MPRDLTQFERMVLHKLLSKPDIHSLKNAREFQTIEHWFIDDNVDRAQKAIEYFASEPDFPIKQTQDGRIYVNPTEDLSKWIDKVFGIDTEEYTEEDLREMVKELKELNKIIHQELLDERKESQNERNKSEKFRRNARRWKVGSILISVASFLIGTITEFGFL